ncbi:MAG: M56 family metallopeptidase [Planctomycetota bacterium]
MNVVFEMIQSGVLETLGMTIVHSIWQIAIVALMFKVSHFLIGDNSVVRYRVAMLALVCSLCIPVFTFSYLHQNRLVVAVESLETAVEPAAPASEPISGQSDEPRFEFPGLAFDAESTDLSASGPVDRPHDEVAATRLPARLPELLALCSPWVGALWLVGVAMFAIRPALGIRSLSRIRNTGTSNVDKRIEARLHHLASQIGLKRAVSIVQSTLVNVPTVIGFLKPVVLLPVASINGLTPQQLDAILLHELAHLKRRDDWCVAIQSFVETVLFFHPAVWWISSHAERERENCCDDVASESAGSPLPLASALLELAKINDQRLLALGSNGGSLVERVRRLRNRTEKRNTSSSRWLSATISIGLALLITMSVAVTVNGSSGNDDNETADASFSVDEEDEGSDTSSVVIDGPRKEIIEELRTLDDAQLKVRLEGLHSEHGFIYKPDYGPCLCEIVSRANEDWAVFLEEQLTEVSSRTYEVGPDYSLEGRTHNAQLLTALRRVQGQPDPFEIIVEQLPSQFSPLEMPKVKVTIRNRDSEPIGFQQGGDNRSGRQTRWRISMTDSSGHEAAPIVHYGIGGGISSQRMLEPGESWETELITGHMVDVPHAGHYKLQVQYSNVNTIIQEPSVDGLIVSTSEPALVFVEPLTVVPDEGLDERIRAILGEIDLESLPHLLQGDYGRWAWDFLPPESPYAQIIQIGAPAIPVVASLLEQSESTAHRAHCIALLYSLTGKKEPHFLPDAIGEYRFLRDSWGMLNSVQVSQQSGRSSGGSFDADAQQQMAEYWQNWVAGFVTTRAAQDEREQNQLVYEQIVEAATESDTGKWVVIGNGTGGIVEEADSLETAIENADPTTDDGQQRIVFRLGVDDQDSELVMSPWMSGRSNWWQFGTDFISDHLEVISHRGWHRGDKLLETPDGKGKFGLSSPAGGQTLSRSAVASMLHEQELTITESDAKIMGLHQFSVPGEVTLQGWGEVVCSKAWCRVMIPELEVEAYVVAVIIPDQNVAGDPPLDVPGQAALLISHPDYPKFAKGDFVMTGRILRYEPLGLAQGIGEGDEPVYLHRFEFSPGRELHGEFVDEVEQLRREAGLDGRLTVTAIVSNSIETFEGRREVREDAEGIFVLNRMRAGAMAGTLPVQIEHFVPADPITVVVAEHACSNR